MMELKWSTVELFDRILISEGFLYWHVMFMFTAGARWAWITHTPEVSNSRRHRRGITMMISGKKFIIN